MKDRSQIIDTDLKKALEFRKSKVSTEFDSLKKIILDKIAQSTESQLALDVSDYNRITITKIVGYLKENHLNPKLNDEDSRNGKFLLTMTLPRLTEGQSPAFFKPMKNVDIASQIEEETEGLEGEALFKYCNDMIQTYVDQGQVTPYMLNIKRDHAQWQIDEKDPVKLHQTIDKLQKQVEALLLNQRPDPNYRMEAF